MTAAAIFDLAMLLVVIFFAVKGVFHGFSGEVFSFLGVVCGLYFGFAYREPVDALLRSYFPSISERFSWIIAVAIVFLCICIVCSLLGKGLSALLSLASLSTLDRTGGFLVGFAKGAAVVIVIVLLLQRVQNFLPIIDMSESRAAMLVDAYLPGIESYFDKLFPNQNFDGRL